MFYCNSSLFSAMSPFELATYRSASSLRPHRMTEGYDFFVGRPEGVKEITILTRLIDMDNNGGHKFFMPADDEKQQEPTVKICGYFFVDEEEQLCSFEDLKKDNSAVFLHGIVVPWTGAADLMISSGITSLNIGNFRAKRWLVFS